MSTWAANYFQEFLRQNRIYNIQILGDYYLLLLLLFGGLGLFWWGIKVNSEEKVEALGN